MNIDYKIALCLLLARERGKSWVYYRSLVASFPICNILVAQKEILIYLNVTLNSQTEGNHESKTGEKYFKLTTKNISLFPHTTKLYI